MPVVMVTAGNEVPSALLCTIWFDRQPQVPSLEGFSVPFVSASDTAKPSILCRLRISWLVEVDGPTVDSIHTRAVATARYFYR